MKMSVNTALITCLLLAVALGGCNQASSPQSSSVEAGGNERDAAFLSKIRNDATLQGTKTARAQERVGALPGTSQSPDSLPIIELGTDHYEMGLLPNDKKSKGAIKVYNRGKAPLEILRLRNQCGCTKGVIRDKVIPGGGETVIDVTIDPARVGPTWTSTKTITLHTNDPKTSVVSVRVSCELEREFMVEPDAIDFGNVAKGETATETVLIRQLDDNPLQVTGVNFARNEDRFEATLAKVPESVWKVPGKAEYKVACFLEYHQIYHKWTTVILPNPFPAPKDRCALPLEYHMKQDRVQLAVNAGARGSQVSRALGNHSSFKL